MTSSKYIILEGGMVASYAAKELASRGLRSGELMIISAEDALPYERPPPSKGFLSRKETEDGILIHNLLVRQMVQMKIKISSPLMETDVSCLAPHTTSAIVASIFWK
jgi:hypothetical protein